MFGNQRDKMYFYVNLKTKQKKKIYTGNFANVKKYQDQNLTPISIARFNRYFSGSKLMELAPPAIMIHDPEPIYTPKFKMEVLDKLNATEIFEKIKKLSNGKDVVLLCYEKEGDFCHRHLVADWLSLNLDIEIKELGKCEHQHA